VTRRLLLLRHGKADNPPAVKDVDRPLANRGRGQALLAGEAVRERGLLPDRVVCSPARRTRDTWEAFAIGLQADPELRDAAETDDRIYDNTLDDLLDVIHETPSDVTTLLLVGHNPAVAGLAGVLDEDGGGPAHRVLAEGFPAGALAVFSVDGKWSEVRAGTARLDDFIARRP